MSTSHSTAMVDSYYSLFNVETLFSPSASITAAVGHGLSPRVNLGLGSPSDILGSTLLTAPMSASGSGQAPGPPGGAIGGRLGPPGHPSGLGLGIGPGGLGGGLGAAGGSLMGGGDTPGGSGDPSPPPLFLCPRRPNVGTDGELLSG